MPEQNRDKQIDEMAKVMCEDCEKSLGRCEHKMCDAVLEQAETLYNAGYRKASEVVEEVFEWLEEKGFLNIEVWAIQEVKDELKKEIL